MMSHARSSFHQSLVGVLALAGAAACSDDPPTVCNLVGWTALGPTDTTVAVGASLAPRVELRSCGGRGQIQTRVMLTSADPGVIEVRTAPLRLVALRSGQSEITVMDSTYGLLGHLRVTVAP